jgi:hypothetical protein
MKQRHQSHNKINCYESEKIYFYVKYGAESRSQEVTRRYSVSAPREMAVLEIRVVQKQLSSEMRTISAPDDKFSVVCAKASPNSLI